MKFVVFAALVLCAAANAAQAAEPPTGLVAVLVSKEGEALDLAPVDNPYAKGVALQIRWSELEPAEGRPDWSKLDALFARAEARHKWVQLLVFPGFFSPTWALAGAHTAQFPVQYGPGKGELQNLPLPWDEVYLDRWLAFAKQLGARYGASPSFRVMAATGPTSVSAEFTLPSTPDDLATWQSAGYTPAKYLGAWSKALSAFAADFPSQQVSLSLGYGLNIDNAGAIDPSERFAVRQSLIDNANGALGRRFVLQFGNLDGTPKPDGNGLQYVIGYAGRIGTGLQLRTSVHKDGMGEGGPDSVLRQALDKGLRANNSGRHVDYIEVYAPDVEAPDTQPALQYGASLFEAPR